MTYVDPAVVVPEDEPAGRIFQTCERALARVVDVFRQAGVELPERQYVAIGQVSYDVTDQLVLEFTKLAPAPRTQDPWGGLGPATMLEATLTIHLIRRAPSVDDAQNLPSPAELTDAAKVMLRDMWTLLHGLQVGRAAGSDGETLPGDLPGAPYRSLTISDMTPYGPTGGAGGIVATLITELQ